MSSDLPPAAVPPAPVSTSTPPTKRRRWLLFGCGGLLALMLVIAATVAITLWWIQRPIKPVVLSPTERAAVEVKLEHLDHAPSPEPAPKTELDRPYVPGSKVFKLTERELNGLLNENTDLGKTVRLELGLDAINAYVATRIPEDVPLLGGKMFRARARFRVAVSKDTAPYAVLEDVTVFGLSLPKAWLGGLKGKNLLGDAVGERHGAPALRGVKSLRVEPGAIVLEVEE